MAVNTKQRHADARTSNHSAFNPEGPSDSLGTPPMSLIRDDTENRRPHGMSGDDDGDDEEELVEGGNSKTTITERLTILASVLHTVAFEYKLTYRDVLRSIFKEVYGETLTPGDKMVLKTVHSLRRKRSELLAIMETETIGTDENKKNRWSLMRNRAQMVEELIVNRAHREIEEPTTLLSSIEKLVYK